MVFATPQQLEAYTKGAVPATDPRADVVIRGASKAIARYVGWHVSPPRDETFTLDSDGSTVLQLPTLKLNSVTEARIRGELTDSASYEWTALGLLRRSSGWPNSWRGVTVTVNHGFEDTPDLTQVVLQVASQALSSPTGATREQAGQVAMSWALTAPGVAGGLSLLDRDLAVVNTYKLPGRL